MTTFTTEDRMAAYEPARNPLTTDQIREIWDKNLISPTEADYIKFARALEAAHGIV